MENDKKYPIQEFLSFVESKLKQQDRGFIADLRHGFNSDTAYRCWPHIAQFTNLENHRSRMVWQTIAAGIATLEGSSRGIRFGKSLCSIAMADQSGAKRSDALKTFSNQVRRLLTFSTTEELCRHLPGIIRRAKSKGIGIDFYDLYWDLMNWENPDKEIKVTWANDYWGYKDTEVQQ